MKPNLLLLEPNGYTEEAIALYESFAQVSKAEQDEASLRRQLELANILVVRLGFTLDASFLNLCPLLYCIVSPTTGLNHIDLKHCQTHQIEVLSLREQHQLLETITSTAECTIALMLAAARKLVPAAAATKQGAWNRDAYRGQQLSGKTLGIFGLGRVGRQVALIAQALQMKVIAYDPAYHIQHHFPVEMQSSPQQLVSKSDVVTLHMHLEGNEHFVDEALLSLSKPGAGWVNTSRAGLWDEQALAKLVLNGQLGWVATDVLQGEPIEAAIRESPLYLAAQECSRILISPHIGGATYEAMRTTEMHMAKLCKDWFGRQ